MDVTALKAERAKLFADNHALLDIASKRDGGTLSAEETAEYDKRDARIDEISATVDRATKDEARSATVDEKAPVAKDEKATEQRDADYESTFVKYLRHGMGALSYEERTALVTRAIDADAPELRAQGTTSGAVGGFLIPQGFRTKIIETLKAFGGIANLADEITTDSGNTLPWPTHDGTAELGVILAENTAMADLDTALGTASLSAFMYVSGMIKASLQLVQDSAFDIGPWLASKIGERLGRIQSAHWATGTGTGQPQGLFTGANVGITIPNATGGVTAYGSDGATGTAYNNLLDLLHSVDPAYRASGNARFVVSDTGLKTIRKIRDGQGLPIFAYTPGGASLGSADSMTLLGYPITIDQGVAVPAASARSLGFGDVRAAYVIRRVSGMGVRQLDERYAELLQTAWFGWSRADGKVQDAGAFKVLVNAAS